MKLRLRVAVLRSFRRRAAACSGADWRRDRRDCLARPGPPLPAIGESSRSGDGVDDTQQSLTQREQLYQEALCSNRSYRVLQVELARAGVTERAQGEVADRAVESRYRMDAARARWESGPASRMPGTLYKELERARHTGPNIIEMMLSEAARRNRERQPRVWRRTIQRAFFRARLRKSVLCSWGLGIPESRAEKCALNNDPLRDAKNASPPLPVAGEAGLSPQHVLLLC